MSGFTKPGSNPAAAKLLLFFCRHHVPLIGRLYKLMLNCDIFCDLRNRKVIMPHPYGIIIHSKTQIGQGVVIMQQVTLGGRQLGVNEAPIIEDDVYIGAGAKVLGHVRIGKNAVVGANAVVTRDVPAGATVVGANRILSPEPEAPKGSNGNGRIVRLAK
ncbi:MAG TPA: serine acetyltransferase [Methylophilaceae bacterium]|nr:serine acetyltransferase [Methylophilaceae bacterium]